VFDIPGYGKAPVRDRGGAIQGNRLDVFFDDIGKEGDDDYISGHDRALEWGVQYLKVSYIQKEILR
jgi:3D (Asp-Asp-Asp) domain-containing protein